MLLNNHQQTKINKLIRDKHPRAGIEYSLQFAKDLATLLLSTKYLYDFSKLRYMIELIANGKIPYGKRTKKYHKNYERHRLKKISGNRIDIHIESDWVLLYSISKSKPFTVSLIRTGSHKMLFKKY